MNNPHSGNVLLEQYCSHTGKRLHIHINGVMMRTLKRTSLKIAETAVLFHDLGKINPNFQPKVNPRFRTNLDGAIKGGYSSHAYLSALAFVSFYVENKAIAEQQLGVMSITDALRVIALIARHHGNLPNFLEQILNIEERNKLNSFIGTRPYLPISDYLQYLFPHQSFDVFDPKYQSIFERCSGMTWALLDMIPDKVGAFQETQFAFSSLIESDKRDASDNESERRRNNISTFQTVLADGLTKQFGDFPPVYDSREISTLTLNEVRTRIRHDACLELRKHLPTSDERVFCLNAPTGAGKTYTLLALANEIFQHRNCPGKANPMYGVLYCLPFLSITEQVEGVCRSLLSNTLTNEDSKKNDELLLRCDSRAEHPRIDSLLQQADEGDEEAIRQLLEEDFAVHTFDSSLIITTFVQFFETLMSNRNATLLKLPNFTRSIILIDEIQALPPRLYVFFAAYLDTFCRKFDAYVILSSATMPNLNLPLPQKGDHLQLTTLFPDYRPPAQLLDDTYFSVPCFNRYVIEPLWKINDMETLAERLREHQEKNESVLVVLNTIPDTRALYTLLAPESDDSILLLNTRFTGADRQEKISRCKSVSSGRSLIFLTTQLIEAGVDIDFPIIYRDLCSFPSVVQTAGRCNRNNRQTGRVYLIDLQEKSGNSRAFRVYDEIDRWYITKTCEFITVPTEEKDLLALQTQFFQLILEKLEVGRHPGLRRDEIDRNDLRNNLVLCIREAAFEDTGRFKLIQEVGEQYSIYIPKDKADTAFETLKSLVEEGTKLKQSGNFVEARVHRLKVETYLRSMSAQIVSTRLKQNELNLLTSNPTDPTIGIYLLGDDRNYTQTFGLHVAADANFF